MTTKPTPTREQIQAALKWIGTMIKVADDDRGRIPQDYLTIRVLCDAALNRAEIPGLAEAIAAVERTVEIHENTVDTSNPDYEPTEYDAWVAKQRVLLEAAKQHLAGASGAGEPDWWWCDIDPDESGDTPREAMFSHRQRLVPSLLHSSYVGPTKWGVMYYDEKEDSDECVTFDTKEEADEFCRKMPPAPTKECER